jgi:hypothetical protein
MVKERTRASRRQATSDDLASDDRRTTDSIGAKMARGAGGVVKSLPKEILVGLIVDLLKDHSVEIWNIVTGGLTHAASAASPFLAMASQWNFAPICRMFDQQIGQQLEATNMSPEVRRRLAELVERELLGKLEARQGTALSQSS